MQFGQGHCTINLALLLFVALGCFSCAQLSESPRFESKVEGQGNSVRFSTDLQRQIVIDVFSNSGIGSAEVEQIAGPRPLKVTVRFHLRGLEGLALSYGAVKIYASVSSRGSNEIIQEVSTSHVDRSNARSIQSNERYWIDVAINSLNHYSEDQIPLDDGTIDVVIPIDFLASPHRAFTIEWIDFYR